MTFGKIVFLVVVASATAAMSSCRNPGSPIENGHAHKQTVAEGAEKADMRYRLELDSFRTASLERIEKNRQEIDALRASAQTGKEAFTEDIFREIDELERKNKDIKEKLVAFKNENSRDWKAFRQELSHDLDELGTAFRNLGRKNNK